MQTLDVTNEESELALVKGLRTGKITIQTDDSLDADRDYPPNVNNTLQNFMDERDREH